MHRCRQMDSTASSEKYGLVGRSFEGCESGRKYDSRIKVGIDIDMTIEMSDRTIIAVGRLELQRSTRYPCKQENGTMRNHAYPMTM
jgi:hypothetical protein